MTASNLPPLPPEPGSGAWLTVMRPDYNALRSWAEACRAERDALRAALIDAIECVESWSGYASAYFQDKHDLPGDLARLRAALRGSASALQ